jgi:hypothetical protein
MTRDQAIMVVNNFEKIKHFAAGGSLEFCFCDCRGNFVNWETVSKSILINCLDKMRIPENVQHKCCNCNRGCLAIDIVKK